MIVLLFLMVLIFAWAVWNLIRILDDRTSYRKDRVRLEAALQDATDRANRAESELKQLRHNQEEASAYYMRLQKQVETYKRMIYGELHQEQKNHSQSTQTAQRKND